jgi:hypothetical protein
MQEVLAWAARHGLNESEGNWVESQAMVCLWACAQNSKAREELLCPAVPAQGPLAEWRADYFEFKFIGWSVDTQSWAAYEQEVLESFGSVNRFV